MICKTEQQVRDERDEAIRKEVVLLGKQYFLLSRHTSLIVLENDAMYAKYGVRKGQGDTWAPYAMPATIPVVTMAQTKPADVASDAELFRTPLQIFYAYANMDISGGFANGDAWGGLDDGLTLGLESTIGHGAGQGFGMDRHSFGSTGAPWPGRLACSPRPTPRRSRPAANSPSTPTSRMARRAKPRPTSPLGTVTLTTGELTGVEGQSRARPSRSRSMASARRAGTSSATGAGAELGTGREGKKSWLRGRHAPADGAARGERIRASTISPTASPRCSRARSTTAPRASRSPRAASAARSTPRPARCSTARARSSAPARIAGALGPRSSSTPRIAWRGARSPRMASRSWRPTTAPRWRRAYPELGLVFERAIGDDEPALLAAILPFALATPDHLARWYTITAAGQTVTLTPASGTGAVTTLELDDTARLVAIKTAGESITISWGASGPTAARVRSTADDRDRLHRPMRSSTRAATRRTRRRWSRSRCRCTPAYWRTRLAANPAGSDAWRHAQRQLLAALAALGDHAGLWTAYRALADHGGVAAGDVALASRGLSTATTNDEQVKALAAVPAEARAPPTTSRPAGATASARVPACSPEARRRAARHPRAVPRGARGRRGRQARGRARGRSPRCPSARPSCA